MRLRPLLVVACLVVLGLVGVSVAAGVSDDTSTPAGVGSAGEDDRTTDRAVLPDTVGRYVALGDSYTAGPLIRWVRNDPPACLRSTRNYPAVLAYWLDVDALVDVSCSGADTGDMARPQQSFGERVRPQLDVVTADTELVTIGVGGNDFDLFSDLASGLRGPGAFAVLERTGRRVADVVAQVLARAPDAVVAVVGYPRIVPTGGGCAALPFDRADNRYLDRVEQSLNDQLRQAAVAQGAVYVDTYGPSRGHDACAGNDAWVNGFRTLPMRALALHPFDSGMQATAAALYESLRGRPPMEAARREAAAALEPRPRDAFSRRGQRLAASLLGG